jgi:hypothetical protein
MVVKIEIKFAWVIKDNYYVGYDFILGNIKMHKIIIE